MKRVIALITCWAVFLVLHAETSYAHKASDSYVSVRVEGGEAQVRWDIALRDLEYAIGVDRDEDGKITWGEVRSSMPAILGDAGRQLALEIDGTPCNLRWEGSSLARHSDGTYLILTGDGCKAADDAKITVTYDFLFELDPQHRGLLAIIRRGASSLHVITPEARSVSAIAGETHSAGNFRHFLVEGVWHIWIGFDHVLFLLALLLPSVLARRAEGWSGVSSLREALLNVLKVVTAFTVAHSITLALASLELVALPSRLVETIIAGSVALAALNNVTTLFEERRAWLVAFAFGLIHGFGFASVLGDLGTGGGQVLTALLAFNIGVELGQLAIVIAFVPCAFLVRGSSFYRKVVLAGGSSAICTLAAAWFVERAFDVVLLG